MRVLVVGNGAREHAIVEKFVEAGALVSAYMSHPNPGIMKLADDVKYGKYTDFDSLGLGFKNIDLAFIGNEKAVISGLVDYLNSLGIPVVAPNHSASRIETSKIFARKLLDRHKIKGNPKFQVITSMKEFDTYVKDFQRVVLKPDGYVGDIGVKIKDIHLKTEGEILNYAKELLHEYGKFLLEEFLEGEEFTIHAFCDGPHIELTPMVHDYRTSTIRHSLGSVSSPDQLWPGITANDLEDGKQIIRNAFKSLFEEYGVMYQGVLNGQFIKTKQGVFLLEFNCRLGDPEALNLLKLLKTDFLELCTGIVENNMPKPEFYQNLGTMALYLVPKGYPDNIHTDSIIKIPDNLNVKYYWGHIYQPTPLDPIRTTYKRSLALFGTGQSIAEVRKELLTKAACIAGDLEYSQYVGKEFNNT